MKNLRETDLNIVLLYFLLKIFCEEEGLQFVYLILFGVIVAITVTDVLMHSLKLDNYISANIGLLSGLAIALYYYSKGSFERAHIKEFLSAVLIGIVVLIVATGILIALGISGWSSPYPFAVLAGIYSFKKLSGKRLGIEEAKGFQVRKCPCCQEEISKVYFLKQILFRQNSISFTEKEKGLECQKCNKPILSAERKQRISQRPMFISMIPIIIVGSMDEVSIVNFVVAFAFSFLIFVLLLSKTYRDVDFVCNDESSEEFEYYSIHM